jgi:hypothetical protein
MLTNKFLKPYCTAALLGHRSQQRHSFATAIVVRVSPLQASAREAVIIITLH